MSINSSGGIYILSASSESCFLFLLGEQTQQYLHRIIKRIFNSQVRRANIPRCALYIVLTPTQKTTKKVSFHQFGLCILLCILQLLSTGDLTLLRRSIHFPLILKRFLAVSPPSAEEGTGSSWHERTAATKLSEDDALGYKLRGC